MNSEIKKMNFYMLFPKEFHLLYENLQVRINEIYEIRIRKNQPITIVSDKGFLYVDREGKLHTKPECGVPVSVQEMERWISHLCRNSVYAYQGEMAEGFFTVSGGHRIGVTGQTVYEGDKIVSLKYISSMNIRIAHEMIGCADTVLPFLFENNQICSTLIVSPPRCGKTTLLRDLIRSLAKGNGQRDPIIIGVIDERGELAAGYMGCAQNDLGPHADIITNCKKEDGIIRLLRSMSPQVIAMDELGGEKDVQAIKRAFSYGCKILATIHGTSFAQISLNEWVEQLLSPYAFNRIIELKEDNSFRTCVYDYNGKQMNEEMEV